MKLNDEQRERLANRLIQKLREDGLIEVKGSESDLIELIRTVLSDFESAAAAVEQAVHKLMDQYSGQIQSSNLDSQQLYAMMRKQVAKEKKFELDPEEQVNQMAHRIHDGLYHDDLVDYPDEDKALRQIKATLNQTLHVEDELDERVRDKIRSLKRSVPEGSPEWNALYRKYMDEELYKKRL